MSLKDWSGLDGLAADALLAELRPDAERAVLKAALVFQAGVVETLSGPRHGRVYKVTGFGALHVASAPGEPPAVLWGTLRASIAWEGPLWEGWTVSATVGTNVIYAARLEFGGIDSRGVKIEARPYMEPTAIRLEPQIEALFAAVAGS